MANLKVRTQSEAKISELESRVAAEPLSGAHESGWRVASLQPLYKS
jgi:hypothetical protein